MNNPTAINQHPTCPKCGSDNVAADAAARWSSEHQTWEVSAVFDKGHGCDACGAEDIEFKWVEVSLPPEVALPQGNSGRGTGSEPDDPASYSFVVAWTIDVEADSPHDAAASARATQLDPDSIATVFSVRHRDGTVLCIDTANGETYPEENAASHFPQFLVTR
jgi:hypothetical protein